MGVDEIMSIETKYTGEWFDCETTPPEHAGKMIVLSDFGTEFFATYEPESKRFLNERGHEIVWPKWWTEIPEGPK